MRFRCRFLHFCVWWLACGVAVGQPIAPSPNGGPTTTESVQEAKPDLFYLKDKDGKLEPVLGFTLDDFERLLTQGNRRDLTPIRPSYRIDKLVVRGDATSDRASLTSEFSITVDDDHWVRVPLRLTEAVVQGKPTYRGPGKFFLEYDAARSEYVAWLNGKSDEPHQLSVPILVPLTSATTETRLKLSLPRALSSELALFVPTKHALAQIPPGSILESAKPESKGTRLRVLGLTAEFSMSWRQAEVRAVEAPTVLESSGALLVRIDGRSVHTQAHLTVRSFGGAFDSFQVRLPPGAVLLTSEQPEYSVKLAANERSKQAGNSMPLVDVRLRSSTVGPVSIRFATTQPFELSENTNSRQPPDDGAAAAQGDRVELGGFEVVGAVRQWGHVAVQVVGDWQVTWGQRKQVRQVEDVPAELWRDDMLAAFEYFAQPFSLEARVLPRETRIALDAQYVAAVGDRDVALDARLKYRISGAKAFELKIACNDWQVDEVGPAAVVDIDDLSPTDNGMLTIPLSKPTTGNLEISLRAHRKLAEQASTIDFSLPMPMASSLGPATLIVLPDDNVELTPSTDSITGLAVQHSLPSIALPVRQQTPLVYQSEQPDARFAAQLRVFQRSVTTGVRSLAIVSDRRVQVEQQLDYTIKHEAAPMLSLQIPSAILDQGNLLLRAGARPLEWSVVADDIPNASGLLLVHVELPEPTIGAFGLTAKFDMAIEPLTPRSTVPLTIPLILPTDVVTASELSVTAPQEMRVQLADSSWQASESAKDRHSLDATSSSARDQISLTIKVRPVHAIEQTVVDRAWIQSWLGERSRQDRAAYQLVTADRNVTIKLPAGVT
ncbi:MAG TPA: hypothetical protein VG713_18585, partial [Pirellulales bacterium]|nr:hypothetical protein [Pirellulales bacterium]